MSLFGKFFHRTKAEQSVGWEKTSIAKVPQLIQDTRHYLEDHDYQLPKDVEEDNRLDFQHYALFHAIGNHYVAPISSPLYTILDVGTGTGIWVSEMANLFPSTVVVGLDIASSSFKEPISDKCFLRVGNVLTGLPFPDAFFSFTHQRLLIVGLTAENWPRAIHELVRVTNHNGWVELIEADDQIHNAGPATLKMLEMMRGVSNSLGFDGEVVRHLGDLLIQENLQKVEMQTILIPVGEWGGRVGSMMKSDLLTAAAAMRGRYAPLAGVTREKFDQMLNAMAEEWEAYHSSYIFY
ncbi:MAG: class I SAM-dependent methyltransferase, partial [Ktedonobacteraceae bacterium]